MLPAATQRRLCSRPCLCKQPRRSTQGGPHLQHSRKHQPPLWPGCKHPAVVEAASTPAFDSFCCRTPPALLHELRPTVIALRQAFHPATRVGWLTALLVRSLAVIRSVLGLTSPLLLTCLLLCAGSVTLPHSRILGLSPCACHPAALAHLGPVTLCLSPCRTRASWACHLAPVTLPRSLVLGPSPCHAFASTPTPRYGPVTSFAISVGCFIGSNVCLSLAYKFQEHREASPGLALGPELGAAL